MYVQLKVFVTYLSILFQICSCHGINGFLRNICTVFLTLCHNTFICSDALPDTSYILADMKLFDKLKEKLGDEIADELDEKQKTEACVHLAGSNVTKRATLLSLFQTDGEL